ncbi:universal stress protein [Pseudonocardia acidicola]|uniref:Universal stress protein n=1 Tax=Pseudonocardia acidicola TaxID=2724939 RepID=A0ABX1SG11_9PSEU|nr:universal stress protein [Pseudonocardia acidicola]NMI00494.1 universal stress protein [Pseudonocardia acidicola]
MRSGPVLIGFDGTSAAEQALREAAELLAPRPALVVVVVEPDRAFTAVLGPILTANIPATTTEIRTAVEVEQKTIDEAKRLAGKGAAMAQEAGFPAEGLAVADDASVAGTLVRLAEKRNAQSIVLGHHRYGALSEIVLGSTARDVIKRAPCPVLVVRESDEPKNR